MLGARGEPERAARLLGAADEVFESAGMSFHPYNTSAYFHERYLTLARNQLEEQGWSAAGAEGRAMAFEQAVAYALEDDEAYGDLDKASHSPRLSRGAASAQRNSPHIHRLSFYRAVLDQGALILESRRSDSNR